MRFRRWHRPEPYRDTSRKRTAFHRKQRIEREALPLFAQEIAGTQHDVDEEMARRAIWWDDAERERRNQRAAWWRRGRAQFFALPDALRAKVRAIWAKCPFPADPASFSDFLYQIAIGKLDVDNPPWIFRGELNPRITRDPQTFAQAFRRIGRKEITGPANTASVEELIFCGNLGTGILFVSTRARPTDQDAGLCADPRLGGPHHGRSSHWVDLKISGVCSDAELALIERLAQAVETRPVVARRASAWAGSAGAQPRVREGSARP